MLSTESTRARQTVLVLCTSRHLPSASSRGLTQVAVEPDYMNSAVGPTQLHFPHSLMPRSLTFKFCPVLQCAVQSEPFPVAVRWGIIIARDGAETRP
jgi:hypothetical protein